MNQTAPLPVVFDGGTIEVGGTGLEATVRCVAGAQTRWIVRLPLEAKGGYISILDVIPGLLDGMLFVTTICEHGHAGGLAYAEVHRVLPGGKIAWGRMVDLRGSTPKLRIADGALGVTARWRMTLLEDRDFEERWLDLDTGLPR